ncbi:MAG: NUDIX domain-containing protein, partial [Pseudomonadota bacterium]|nr:NUDIX domain-containing protein [Pseudomonadota bacterium]
MYAAAEGKSRLKIPEKVGKEFVRGDEESLDCAGILFRKDNKYLLIRRTDNGIWEAPGGHAEEGESFEEAAIREACEEIGDFPDGNRWAFRESGLPGIHYVTFLQDMDEFILPTLSDEHVEYMWADSSEIPESIHPEVMRHIDILNGTEFDIENAIVTGELFSPQHFENVWLFDVRVTGTGTSYRTAHEEYVYRPPENFLTPEFVQRCNGLPVIFEHPEKLLTTDEYRDRAIGTIVLPYATDTEVRGIAKIYDEDAAHLMMTTHASTSPAVVFRMADSTESIELSNGESVLIEGKPSYIDHLAICSDGVWDKGNGPSGINLGETTVT